MVLYTGAGGTCQDIYASGLIHSLLRTLKQMSNELIWNVNPQISKQKVCRQPLPLAGAHDCLLFFSSDFDISLCVMSRISFFSPPSSSSRRRDFDTLILSKGRNQKKITFPKREQPVSLEIIVFRDRGVFVLFDIVEAAWKSSLDRVHYRKNGFHRNSLIGTEGIPLAVSHRELFFLLICTGSVISIRLCRLPNLAESVEERQYCSRSTSGGTMEALVENSSNPPCRFYCHSCSVEIDRVSSVSIELLNGTRKRHCMMPIDVTSMFVELHMSTLLGRVHRGTASGRKKQQSSFPAAASWFRWRFQYKRFHQSTGETLDTIVVHFRNRKKIYNQSCEKCPVWQQISLQRLGLCFNQSL